MDETLCLYRHYYLSVSSHHRLPDDLGVQFENAVSPKGGPMFVARLKIGDLKIEKEVVGYRLCDCTKTFLQDLRESTVYYFVQQYGLTHCIHL